MNSQQVASFRNAGAEIVAITALELAIVDLSATVDAIEFVHAARQVSVERPDLSDRYDGLVVMRWQDSELELWVQVTCYKGLPGGGAESNKTYEIRETLIEGLGLRRWLITEAKKFRFMHITFGPEAYGYGWMKYAKACAYDRSIYVTCDGDIDSWYEEFVAIGQAPPDSATALASLRARLDDDVGVGAAAREIYSKTQEWLQSDFPTQPLADLQAELLAESAGQQELSTKASIEASRRGGAGIKDAISALRRDGGEDSSGLIASALKRVSEANPFVADALEAEEAWAKWAAPFMELTQGSLEDIVRSLWTEHDVSRRRIVRRILVRLHDPTSATYVQDLGVARVTEHNLYSETHDPTEVAMLVDRLCQRLRAFDIASPETLIDALTGDIGRSIVINCRSAEIKNGAGNTPSLYFATAAIESESGLFVTTFPRTHLERPIAYHYALSEELGDGNPYTAIKVVCSARTDSPLALLKAKYFSNAEFPRRCKEEAYVGLTTLFGYESGTFFQRYDIPLFMFVDMSQGLVPPEYAIKRLSGAGWHVFFSVKELVSALTILDTDEA